MRTIAFAAGLLSVVAASAAVAAEYTQFPAPTPYYPFQRSAPTGRLIVLPPYDRPFVERVYTTPPTQPYYNVPPYTVIAPY